MSNLAEEVKHYAIIVSVCAAADSAQHTLVAPSPGLSDVCLFVPLLLQLDEQPTNIYLRWNAAYHQVFKLHTCRIL